MFSFQFSIEQGRIITPAVIALCVPSVAPVVTPVLLTSCFFFFVREISSYFLLQEMKGNLLNRTQTIKKISCHGFKPSSLPLLYPKPKQMFWIYIYTLFFVNTWKKKTFFFYLYLLYHHILYLLNLFPLCPTHISYTYN